MSFIGETYGLRQVKQRNPCYTVSMKTKNIDR